MEMVPIKKELTLESIIQKYSASQPRDENGRWTVGGRSSAGQPKHPFQFKSTPFLTGNIAKTSRMVTDTLNKVDIAEIEGDGKGLYKSEAEETKGKKRQRHYKDCEDFMELAKCSMAKREVMAYQLDEMLGVGLCPETSWKKNKKGEWGSCQQFVEGLKSVDYRYLDKKGWKALTPEQKKAQLANAAAFDDLIASTDRHSKNVKISKEGNLVFIDNGLSFSHTPQMSWNKMFVEMGGSAMIKDSYQEYQFSKGNKPIKEYRKEKEYVKRGKEIGKKALENKKHIDNVMEIYDLPSKERSAFWERAEALSKGKFYEYDKDKEFYK